MPAEASKQLVERFIGALYDDGDLAAIDRHVSPDVAEHGLPGTFAADVEGTRAWFRMFLGAFWGAKTWVETIHVQGDKVFVRTITRGVHSGEFLGLPASGQRAMLCSHDIYRVRGGMIVEHWGSYAAWAAMTDASGSRPRVPRAA